MNDQLALLAPGPRADDTTDDPSLVEDGSWELDDRTRHVGRLGLAAARQALRHASSGLAA